MSLIYGVMDVAMDILFTTCTTAPDAVKAMKLTAKSTITARIAGKP